MARYLKKTLGVGITSKPKRRSVGKYVLQINVAFPTSRVRVLLEAFGLLLQ